MPYGIWKFIILDLKELESLIVVRSCSEGCEEEGWGTKEVEGKLEEARTQFLGFWEQLVWYGDGDDEELDSDDGGPDDEVKRLKEWKIPRVEVLELEELVARCWV